MYDDDELLPLSALQHLLFCERQCALIHIEGEWFENILTAQGRLMHEKAHHGVRESRDGIIYRYGMFLRSFKYGLIGKADLVQFHKKNDFEKSRNIWSPFPVEYKRGKTKKNDCDRVQLCAQAFCLEEMLNIRVNKGAIFYGETRKREDVLFSAELRTKTEQSISRLHRLMKDGKTPPPILTPGCKKCSFIDTCLPKAISQKRSVEKYLYNAIEET